MWRRERSLTGWNYNNDALPLSLTMRWEEIAFLGSIPGDGAVPLSINVWRGEAITGSFSNDGDAPPSFAVRREESGITAFLFDDAGRQSSVT